MDLSDTAKIVSIVVSPVLGFSLLFAMVVIYRRRTARLVLRHLESGPVDNREPARVAQCDHCRHKEYNGISGNPRNQDRGELIRSDQDVKASRRRSRVTQPHFAEKTIRIRRISCRPGQEDTIQRVNSIASTLSTAAHPSSEVLPYGCRKSSMDSNLTHSSLLVSKHGTVEMGQRRPSVLSDPEVGMVKVRRVSVGGHEDIVKVRSASQSSRSRRKSRASEIGPFDLTGSMETLPTPTLPSAHPFSSGPLNGASISRSSTVHRLDLESKRLPSNREASDRSDSVILTKSRTPTTSSPHRTVDIALHTAVSHRGIKSPPSVTDFTLESPDFTAEVFENWRGFEPGDCENLEPVLATAEPLSPKTPKLVQALVDESSPYWDMQQAKKIPAMAETGSTTQLPLEISAIPAVTVTPSHSASPQAGRPEIRNSKLTYLADVVRENDERRKREQAEGC